MRVLLQRVASASVSVEGEAVAEIERGLLLFVGAAAGDTAADASALAAKVATLRIFPDEAGRFDRVLLDTGDAALVISQFTLLAETRRGRRPSFDRAARPEEARTLVAQFGRALAALGVPVAYGRFGASMRVTLINDGPVTILLDTRESEQNGGNAPCVDM